MRDDDLLDLAPALARCRGEKCSMVGGRQVRSQEPPAREVQRTLAEHVTDDRKPPANARRHDAVVRLMLGEAQNLGAVREERREARGQVEPTSVELGQVSDERGGGLTLAPGAGPCP